MNDNKERETVIVRGIAAAIQAMVMPTFENLRKILRLFGFNLTSVNENKQTNNEKQS